jgi:hypothetical protein
MRIGSGFHAAPSASEPSKPPPAAVPGGEVRARVAALDARVAEVGAELGEAGLHAGVERLDAEVGDPPGASVGLREGILLVKLPRRVDARRARRRSTARPESQSRDAPEPGALSGSFTSPAASEHPAQTELDRGPGAVEGHRVVAVHEARGRAGQQAGQAEELDADRLRAPRRAERERGLLVR